MWRVILGVGIVSWVIKSLFEDEGDIEKENKKRIFVSFSMKDKEYRGHLVSQAKDDKTPFAFVDMSVKKPWNEKEWKQKCRSKIKSCDGLIVLLSKNTWHSSGVRWEIKCAKEEGVPIVGMHIFKNDQRAVPPELKGEKIIVWTWDNLYEIIKKF